MAMIRRLVSLCLVLAFASYGTVAAAPHSHGRHDGHGAALHAIAVDTTDEDHHQHDHGHDAVADLAADGHASDHGDEGTPSHSGFHVHAVAAFTVADDIPEMTAPVTTALPKRIDRASVHPSGLFSPLKKPPRIFL